MKERGILFSAPMVRAILEGRKTQTRRTLGNWDWVPVSGGWQPAATSQRFGVPGDRLWVRETWQAWRQTNVEYDEWEVETDAELMRDARLEYRATSDSLGPWRPCIFMPRWASRITLEITEVRVQRLQDISEADAREEGCSGHDPDPVDQGGTIYAWKGRSSAPCPRAHFLALWDRINGKPETMLDDDGEPVLDDHGRPIKIAPKAWAPNPWVWAITFRRLP